MRSRCRVAAAIVLASLALVACGDDEEEEAGGQAPTTVAAGARADMANAEGRSVGQVTFTERAGRVVVEGTFSGLPPGFHGFHVHAAGRCEPPFMTAAGHLTVGEQGHPGHAGDQPVLLVLGDGTAETRFTTDRYSVSDLLGPAGTAVIVHADADNYSNVPTRYVPAVDAMTTATGDAGGRIACGVVRRP